MSASVELRAILRDEITKGLKIIKDELDQTGAAGKTAGERVSQGMGQAGPSIQSVTQALAQQVYQLNLQKNAMKTPEYQAYAAQQKQIRKEIEEMTRPTQTLGDKFLNVGTMVKGFMALQAVGYFKDMGVAIYEATAEMDSMKRGLSAVMGSSTLAAAEMEKLKEVAKLPGLGYGEAIRMSTSLQAAGMSADLSRKAMMSFGNALATVGKGKADLDGVGLALSQIMSKGKVSAEEINQIAERVPQIRKAMMDAFGTADTELLGKAGISSANFIASVSDELGKLEKATGGVRNGSENLADSWFRLKATIGGSGSIFTQATDGLAGLIEKFNQYNERGVKKDQAAAIRAASEEIKRWNNGIRESSTFSPLGSKSQEEKVAAARKLFADMAAEQAKAGAAEKAQAEKRRADFEAGLGKQIGGKKAALQTLLAVERKNYEANLAEAKANGASIELVEKAHQAEMARIKEGASKGDKKPKAHKKTVQEKADDSFASDRLKLMADLDIASARVEQTAVERENKRYQESVLILQKKYGATKYYMELRSLEESRHMMELAKLEEKEDEREEKSEQEKAEAYAKRIKAREDLRREESARRYKEEQEEAKRRREKVASEWDSERNAMAQRLGMHNSTITAMLKGEEGFSSGMRKMWDDTGTAIINKGLEMAEAWIATEIMKSVFADGARAAEVVKSEAAGAAITAAYAPAAAVTSVATFGSAAVIGGAALAGVLATYAVMRETGGSAMGGNMLVGERGPEGFRPTVPGNIINNHQTTSNRSGDVYHITVYGGDLRTIERQVRQRQRGSR